MASGGIYESIDRLFVKLEVLEKTLIPLLRRDDVKGEAVAIMGIMEELYDELALLRKMARDNCTCSSTHRPS